MMDSIKIVKKIETGLQRYIAENPDNSDIERRIGEVSAINEMIEYVQEQMARDKPVDPDLGDISDLPPELLKELTLSTPSKLEQRILAIIENSEDQKCNINTILVELFRRHGVKQKRRPLNNKLWKMMDQKLIWNIKGQKGVYTTIKQFTDEEILKTITDTLADADDDDDIVPF